MNRILISLGAILSIPAFAKPNCGSYSIEFYQVGQKKNEISNMCYDPANGKITSLNCIGKKCEALTRIKGGVPPHSNSGFGNPKFTACQELGGRAETIRFKYKGRLVESDRCSFQDGSFVNTQQLNND